MVVTFIAAVLLSNEVYKLGRKYISSRQQVGQAVSDQVLGNESSSSTINHQPLTMQIASGNLLKNFSFETNSAAAGPSAFWTFHPNSTNDNTQMSNHTAHSGSYSLLVTAGTGGVIQESTKTEAKRNYTLGVWVKMEGGSKGLTLNSQGETFTGTRNTRIHLALGPGYDKSFPVGNNNGWKYYSTTFSNPPPGLVPRIYVNVERRTLNADQRTTDNAQRTTNNESFVFLDDAVFAEIQSLANASNEANVSNGSYGGYLASSFQTLLPSGGNVMSISAQGIFYPTDSTQTQGGLGLESSRIGKMWGSNIDISQSLSVNEKVDISGKLTANGNIALGNNDGDEIEVGGRFISDLLPKQSNAVSIGTSAQRWNNFFTATGNISNNLTVGGSTTITGLLTVNGGLSASGGSGLSVTGDLALDGDLDFQGPQNITTTSDNLTISPTGSLILDSSGGTVAVRDNLTVTGNANVSNGLDVTNGFTVNGASSLGDGGTTNYLAISNTGDLTMNGTSNNIIANNDLVIRSGGSLTLDTSASNNNLLVRTGSGTFDVSVGNYQLTVNSKQETVNGNVTETVTGNINRTVAGNITDRITGANNYVLRVGDSASDSDANGNDIFLSAVDKITLHSSSFTQNTSGNTETIVSAGDYSVIVQGNNDLYLRGGGAGRDDITNGGDLQLSAQDSMILDAGDLTITGSEDSSNSISISAARGGITLSTSNASGNGNLSLYSAGTLTLDTSRNNSNLRLQTGSGTLSASLGTATLSTENGAFTLLSRSAPLSLITESTTNGSLILSSTGNLYLDTSRTGASVFLQGGLVRVGSAGTVDNISGSGSLYVQNDLEVDGNVYLGTSTANSLSVSGYVTSNLIPNPGSQYDLGSNTRRWSNLYADTVTASNIAGTVITGSTSAANWTIDVSNATADLEDVTVTFERGTEVVNSELRWNSSGDRYFSTNASFQVSPDTGIGLPTRPEQAIMVVNDSYGGRRLLTLREAGSDVLNVDSSGNILLSQASNIETSSGALTVRGYDGLTLTTSSATTGEIRVISRGTLQLDTSTNNDNILIRAGSGSINLSSGTTTISGNVNLNSGTLALNGLAYTFPGSQSANNVLLTNGSGLLSWTTLGGSSITADSLDFSEFKDSMNLDADTSINGPYSFTIRAGAGSSQSTVSGNNDIWLAAEDRIDLRASSLTLSTSSTSAGELRVTSSGSLILDTSGAAGGGAPIVMLGGNVGIGTTSPSHKLTVSNTAVSTDGIEIAQQSSVLYFTDLNDGEQSGSLQFDNGRFLFINATEKMRLSATGGLSLGDSYVGTDPGAGSMIISGNMGIGTTGPQAQLHVGPVMSADASFSTVGRLTGSAAGTLPLLSLVNTAAAATNNTATINFGFGTAWSPTGYMGAVLENAGTAATGLAFGTYGGGLYERLRIDNAGNVGIGSISPQGILDVVGDYSIIMRAGLGAVQNSTSGDNDIQIAAEDRLDLYATSFSLTTSGNSVDILSGGRIDLSAKGTLTLDTSQNNTNILMTTGSGNINVSTGTLTMTGVLDVRDSTGTYGLVVDSTGNVGIGTTAPLRKFDIRTSDTTAYSSTSIAGDGAYIYNLNNSGASGLFSSLTFRTSSDNAASNALGAINLIQVDYGSHQSSFAFQLRSAGGSYIEAMRMLSTGNIGIASTSPAGILDIGTSAAGILLRAGQPGITISSSSAGHTADIQIAAPDRIDMFASSFSLTTSNTSDGSLKLTSYGNLTLDTSQNNGNIIFNTGTGGITQNLGTYIVNATADQIGAIALNATRGGITLSSSQASSNGNIFIKSAGTLQLDTSAKNANILLMPGTGNVGIGTASPTHPLELSKDVAVDNIYAQLKTTQTLQTADLAFGNGTRTWGLRTSGNAGGDFALMDLTQGSTPLTVLGGSTGNVGIGTTSPAELLHVYGANAAVGSNTNHGNMLISTSDAMTIDKGGSIALGGKYSTTDTTTYVDFGKIHGKKENTTDDNTAGYLAFETTANSPSPYSFERMRITSGGNVGIGTTTPGYKFVIDPATVYSAINTGDGFQLIGSTIGTNANLVMGIGSSGNYIALQARDGTASGWNLALNPYGGNVGIGSTVPVAKLDVVSGVGAGTTEGINVTGSDSQSVVARFARPSVLEKDFTIQVYGNSQAILASEGDLVLATDQSGQDQGIARLMVKSTSGNIGIGSSSPAGILDVVGDKSILLRAGTGAVSISGSAGAGTDDIQLAAEDRIDLFAGSLSLQTSSQTAGELKLMSKGSLILDTSGAAGGGAPIVMLGGNVGIGSTAPARLLDVYGSFRAIGSTDLGDGEADSHNIYGDVSFKNNSGTTVFIDQPSGSVGIGTTVPGYKLHVYQSGSTSPVMFTLENADNTDTGSHSRLNLISGGTSGGDPFMTWEVNGGLNYYMGIDNSSTSPIDPLLIGRGTTVGSNVTLALDTNGNVGIGTTSPTGILDILGQCVTGDTVLKRRRRRRRRGKNGEWVEEEYFEDVRIDEIKEGDEILSMEPDGSFDLRKVISVMEKGYQAIYKLVTHTGKQIRTTAIHPYFVLEKRRPAELKKLYATFEVDQSNRLEDMGVDSVVALASSEMDQVITVKISKKIKRAILQKNYSTRRKLFGPEMLATLIVYAIWDLGLKVGRLIIDEEYSGYENNISDFIRRIYPEMAISFKSIGHQSMAHRAAWSRATKKKTLTRSVLIKAMASLDFEESLASELLHPGLATRDSQSTRPILPILYQSRLSLSRGEMTDARWIPARNIHKGMLVATVDGWEVITGIYKTGVREETYDIEVEGTHNFVGNGIVAHNTTGILMRAGASSLQLSSSATSTTADIQLAAADRIDLFASSLSISTSSRTAGELRLTSSGSLILDTSGAAGGGAPIVMLGGNVGVGTTGPTANLQVAGSGTATVKFNTTSASSPVDFVVQGGAAYWDTVAYGSGAAGTTYFGLADATSATMWAQGVTKASIGTYANAPFILGTNNLERVRISSGGNVGIGTTSPGAKLDIYDLNSGASWLLVDPDNTQIKIGNVNNGYIKINYDAFTFQADNGTDFLVTSLGLGDLFLIDTANEKTVFEHNSVGIGTTSPGGILDVVGASAGILLRAGDTSLQLSSGGEDAEDLQLAAADRIDLFASSLSLNTSSTTAGTMQLVSKGSLILDTSSSTGGTAPIILQGGNVGIGSTAPGSKFEVIGASAANSLVTFGSGSGNATDLVFRVLGDTSPVTPRLEVRRDGQTTITSAASYGLLIPSGNVGVGTSSPASKLDVSRTGTVNKQLLTLTDDGISGITNGELFFDNTGAGGIDFGVGHILNNTSFAIRDLTNTGSPYRILIDTNGNIGIGTTSPLYTLDVSGGTRVIGDAGVILRAGRSSVNLSSGTTSTTADLQFAAADRIDMFASSFNLTTSNTSDGSLKLTSYGNLTLDTSQNNGNIIFNTGTGGITQNLGTYTVNATTDQVGAIALNATRGGVTLSSSQASSNGNIFIKSAGTLQLDTSAKNANILLLPGTGNVGIGTTAPGAPLYLSNASNNPYVIDRSGSYSVFGAGNSDAYPFAFSGNGTDSSTALYGFGLFYRNSDGDFTIARKNNSSSFSEAFRIQRSSGNIGIGNTTPIATLDAVGNNGIILRAGQSALNLSSGTTSTTADLQLAAADRIDLFASSLSLSTSSRTAGELRLTSSGSLILDTSGAAGGGAPIVMLGGNVGIGTTGPGALLSISGAGAVASPGTSMINLNNTHGTANDEFGINFTNTGYAGKAAIMSLLESGGANSKLKFYTGGSPGLSMVIDSNANVIISGNCSDAAGGGGCTADYAEVYLRDVNSPMGKTDVLALDTNTGKVVRADAEHQSLIGIFSSAPGSLIGQRKSSIQLGVGKGVLDSLDPDEIPVAIAGRVPAKIAPDSQPIVIGDFLTSSDTYPGMAMKAIRAGYTIGKALESWSTTSRDEGQGLRAESQSKQTIMVFVNISYYMGSMTADGYIDTGLKMKVADIALTVSSESLSTSSEIATSSATPRNDGLLSLQTRVTQLEDLVAIMAGTNTLTTSTGFKIQDSGFMISGSYMDNEVNLGGGLISPLVETKLTLDASTGQIATLPIVARNDGIDVLGSATIGGNLTIGLLTINDLDASINSMGETLKLQSSGLSNIELMSGKIVIDTEGNIKVEGNVEAQTVAAQEFKVLGTKSSGSAILRAGELTLSVSADVITPESRVFTQQTVIPGEDPGSIQIDSGSGAGTTLIVRKLPGIGFEVRPAIPAETDISFDWFVIGGE